MGIFSKLTSLFARRRLDAAVLGNMEDALISADIAPDLAVLISAKLRAKFKPDADTTETDIKSALFDILKPYADKLSNSNKQISAIESQKKPLVFLVIGVNGAGKTTTIGKLAKLWTGTGKKVIIGSCDTFRAAAGEQLAEWAERADATLVCGDKDPAAAAYKTIEIGKNEKADIVLLDTAGRLHNRTDLMDELAKIIRVVKKLDPDAPHETLLILDGTAGQNALAQIEYFDKVAPLSGLVVTKMDSTSKGGFLITYASRTNPLPVFAIGAGERISDLHAFNTDEYLQKLLDL
ncbi:MAG: signal recognition particle-docking protein FtsY [Alphaproteobacteria bacterium]|nr:signal recognition particle-docking protein FtsY [Alphaproteobacteria bacterium]